MKKLLFIFCLMILQFPADAAINTELKPDSDYILFTNDRVKSIIMSDNDVVSCFKIITVDDTKGQISLRTDAPGKVNLRVFTESGEQNYKITVRDGSIKMNSVFTELDMPAGVITKNL